MSVDQRLRRELDELAQRHEPDVEAALARITGAPAHLERRWIPVAAVAAAVVLVAGIALGGWWWRRPHTAQPAGGWGTVGAWTELPDSPLSARHDPVTVFADGLFLVIGGWGSPLCGVAAQCVAPKEPAARDGAAFDPATGRWHRLAKAPVPISGGNSVVVDGMVYLSTPNLRREDSPPTFLRYDPVHDSWTRLPSVDPEAMLVSAGTKVVALPGSDENTTAIDQIFDPAANTWTRLPDDPLGPSFSRDAVWLGDRLLLLAHDLVPNPGATEPSVVRMAILDLTTMTWTVLPDSDVLGGGAVVCAGRVVFPMTGSADGGKIGNWGRDVPYGGIFDPAAGTWKALPTPPRGGANLGTPLVVDGTVLVGGHLLNPVSLQWSRLAALPGPARSAAGVAAGSGAIFVWGGAEMTRSPQNLDTGYLYRLR